MIIRAREKRDIPRLTKIWEDSVRATHHFLTEADVQFYLPMVRDEALPAFDVWVAENETGELLGFIGLSDAKIEMLFVDPACHGQGTGKALIQHARNHRGRLTLDVNEQNPQAHAFYKSCGFIDTGRSELDGSGRPFPLIHMAERV